MPDQPLPIARLGELLEGDSLEVIQEIAPDDPMYAYGPDLYFPAGKTALRCIQLAMLAARLETVETALDFACGKGRVLRVLKAAFPQAALTACDLWPEAVEFCSRTFGATGVVSEVEPGEVALGGPFDLIWSGSLLTHVDSARWIGFLELFESVLSPGGIVTFTVYGRATAQGLRDGTIPLTLNREQAAEVLREYDVTGFGFAPTISERRGRWRAPAVGDCVASRAWVCSQLERIPGLELLLYLERGWLGQDVVACAKSGWGR